MPSFVSIESPKLGSAVQVNNEENTTVVSVEQSVFGSVAQIIENEIVNVYELDNTDIQSYYNEVSRQNAEDAQAAQVAAKSAQSKAETAETNAKASELDAEAAQGLAETAQSKAETAQSLSETARDASQAAQSLSETAQAGAELAESNAKASELDAEAAQVAAETAQSKAETAQSLSETAQAGAELAQSLSETARDASQAAQAGAELAESNAKASELDAETAQSKAETAQSLSETAQAGAETAEANAETAQIHAETAQAGAELAESNAELAESSAIAARDGSITAKNAAIAARDAAQTARTGAETAETNAKASASSANSAKVASQTAQANAETAQSAAETAEANAQASASSAASSASSASTDADRAEAAANTAVNTLSARGDWDASQGVYPTPTANSADFYQISVAGTMTGAQGSMTANIGDQLYWNVEKSVWYKIDNTDHILSVNGQEGAVVLDHTDVGALGATQNAVSASKWQTARTLTLAGDATGAASIDGSSNVTLTVDVNSADKWSTPRTISLSGDVSGSASIDGSANANISVTIDDDSHNHTIGNVDGLQSELDAKVEKSGDELTGRLYGTAMVPNLVHNSYMNLTDANGVPDGFTCDDAVILSSAHPFERGFEGPYWPAQGSATAPTPQDATQSTPYYYGTYDKGVRAHRGGLADGWGATKDGRLLKIQLSGFVDDGNTHCGVFMPMSRNQQGSRWLVSCWVNVKTGTGFSLGVDAGYKNRQVNFVDKATIDAAPDGWYRFSTILNTSHVTNIGGRLISMCVHPDENGDAEALIALPNVMNIDWNKNSAYSWAPSALDALHREGLTIRPSTKLVGINTDDPNYQLDVEGDFGAQEIYENGNRVFSPNNLNISDSVESSDSSVYASSTAVKTANDNANTRVLKSGDTMSGALNVNAKVTATAFAHTNGSGTWMTFDGSILEGEHRYINNRAGDNLARFAHLGGTNNYGFNVFGRITENDQRVFSDAYHPNADKWTTARSLSLGNELSGSVSIDGSSNVTLNASVDHIDNVLNINRVGESNPSIWLNNDTGETRGNIYWNRIDGSLQFRLNGSDGTTAQNIMSMYSDRTVFTDAIHTSTLLNSDNTEQGLLMFGGGTTRLGGSGASAMYFCPRGVNSNASSDFAASLNTSGVMSLNASSSTPLSVHRVEESSVPNVNIRFQGKSTDGNALGEAWYAGSFTNGAGFGIGTNADLSTASNRLFEVGGSGAVVRREGSGATSLTVEGTDPFLLFDQTDIGKSGYIGMDGSGVDSLYVRTPDDSTRRSIYHEANKPTANDVVNNVISLNGLDSTKFYPVVFDANNTAGYTCEFTLSVGSGQGSSPYNNNTLTGVARGGGWSDHNAYYDLIMQKYDDSETNIHSIWEGSQGFTGIVVYVRGGQSISLRGNSHAQVYTSDFSFGGSVFPAGISDPNSAGVVTNGNKFAYFGSSGRYTSWSATNFKLNGGKYSIYTGTNDAQLTLDTDANVSSIMRLSEDAGHHGAYLQYEGGANELRLGTRQSDVDTIALRVYRGSASVHVGNELLAKGVDVALNGRIKFNGKSGIRAYDASWLRINDEGQFTSGIFCGSSLIRTDGQITSGPWSGSYKSARVANNFYDSTWAGNGTAAFSVNNPDTAGAHWAFASFYNGSNIRSGIQILSNSEGRMRFYTNRRSKYVEINGGSVVATGNVTAYSDARLKENVKVIDNALNKVGELSGYTYDKRKSLDSDEFTRETGVIAQEVQKVLPEAVMESDEEHILSVAYGNMNGLLIEAIKELNEKVDSLQNEVQELKRP
ncbi:tail fiber domain-containing protein [Vibrio alginolyticus]|uniref:tail fiber domain-containing protein n=1 Tax=Vibrio alginolyticus TaxID=663 RepID=UPI001BD45E85|nr:tail fiber domain-containing protein [Vibrio alginolyticus]MBS9935780.1 tail fiber domain-containing protein [Vibrio alginolyticus]